MCGSSKQEGRFNSLFEIGGVGVGLVSRGGKLGGDSCWARSGGRRGKTIKGSSVVSLKFIEEQPQILRLTTPELHPTDEDLPAGTPETEKRLGPRSLLMTDSITSMESAFPGIGHFRRNSDMRVKMLRMTARLLCGLRTHNATHNRQYFSISQLSGKNKKAVPRPRGYRGSQEGHPRAGMR